ncbi:unnamed protein product [Staurois parvus]|uniref:Uncharacterized protein n=1 Tax=Staurois parvus TaxID=386267 RepID=A0ABN9GSI5_9NEOB|nr:unnamed protein product [Staurois parvus]
MPIITAYQCLLISAVCQYPSVPPIRASQCCLSVPISVISDACQCCLSIPPISAASLAHIMPAVSVHQCHINATYQCPSELPFSVTHQCQSVPPISAANQCHLSVPFSAAYQCQSVPPISAMYQCHVSVLPFSAHQ